MRFLFKECLKNVSCIFQNMTLINEVNKCSSDLKNVLCELSSILEGMQNALETKNLSNIDERVLQLELLVNNLKEKE